MTTEPVANPPIKFVALIAFIMATMALSIDAVLPALGVISKELHASFENQPQLIITALFLGSAMGQLFAGPLSDALGRKRLFFITMAIFISGATIAALATNMTTILVGRFIQGLGGAGPYVTAVSVVRDRYQGRAMAKVMSLVMIIFIMVPVIAPAIGQGIMLFVHWRWIFVFYVIYALGISFFVHTNLEETLKAENRIEFSLRSILKGFGAVFSHRSTLLYAIATGFVFASFVGYLTSSQQIYQEQYKVGQLFVVWFGLQALGFGLSSHINGRIVERLGMSLIVRRALFVIIALGALMALASGFMTIPFAAFFIFGLISLFCVGMLFGNLNSLAMEAMGHMAGTGAAIISVISSIISLIFGTVIGQAYNGTLIPVSLGFLGYGLIALLLVMAGDRARKHTE